MRIFLLAIIMVILATVPGWTQANFFDRGHTGEALMIGYAQADKIDMLALAGGGVTNGIFDFGIKYGKVFDGGSVWAGYLDYFFLKPSRIANAFSMSAGTQIEYSKVEYNYGQFGTYSKNYYLLSINVAAYYTNQLSKTDFFQPAIGIGLTKLLDDDGKPKPFVSFFPTVGVGIAKCTTLLFQLSVSANFEGDSSFGISTGIVFDRIAN